MPEDSRRWLVCAFAFIAQFILAGLMNCGGVLYTALVDEFKASRGATGRKESKSCILILIITPVNCHKIGSIIPESKHV